MTNQKKTRKSNRQVDKSGSNPVEVKRLDANHDKGIQETKPKMHPVVPRKGSEKAQGIRGLSRYINITTQFIRESKFELKKVKWPTRKELLASTTMVLILVLVIALFLGLIDFALIKIIKMIVG